MKFSSLRLAYGYSWLSTISTVYMFVYLLPPGRHVQPFHVHASFCLGGFDRFFGTLKKKFHFLRTQLPDYGQKFLPPDRFMVHKEVREVTTAYIKLIQEYRSLQLSQLHSACSQK